MRPAPARNKSAVRSVAQMENSSWRVLRVSCAVYTSAARLDLGKIGYDEFERGGGVGVERRFWRGIDRIESVKLGIPCSSPMKANSHFCSQPD